MIWYQEKTRYSFLFLQAVEGRRAWVEAKTPQQLCNTLPTLKQSNQIWKIFLFQIPLLPHLHIPLLWFARRMTDWRWQVARYKLSRQEDSLLDESVWCPNFCRHKKKERKKHVWAAHKKRSSPQRLWADIQLKTMKIKKRTHMVANKTARFVVKNKRSGNRKCKNANLWLNHMSVCVANTSSSTVYSM